MRLLRGRPGVLEPSLVVAVSVLALAAGNGYGQATPRAAGQGPLALPEFDEQVVFTRGEGGYFCFRIPAIARATDGTLLAFAEGRVANCGDSGDIDLVLKRSGDGGTTWTPLQVVLDGNGNTRGNPVPVVDEHSGRVVLVTTYNPRTNTRDRRPFVQHSDDDGATWSAPQDLSEVPFSESLDLAADDFTWSAWIRYAEQGGGHTILWAYRTGSAPTPQVWLRAEPASKRIRALIGAESGTVAISTAGAHNDGEWHHVALQRADGRFALRVDGAEVASAIAPRDSVTAGREFRIDGIHVGQRLDGADRFRGSIDDVRIYRRALSPQELALVRERDAPIGGRLSLWLEFETITPE